MQSLSELLRGKGSHADPIACVEDISEDLASRRIDGFSIADLVFHMNYWMNYELKRIRGEKPEYPEHNAESFPSAPQSWDQLKRDFSWFLGELVKLAESSRAELDRQVESVQRGRQESRGYAGSGSLADGRAQQLSRGPDCDDTTRAGSLAA